ncbi:MAG: hypothetical protein ACM3JB_25360, partial [Acidobacteriaceae bacterium]
MFLLSGGEGATLEVGAGGLQGVEDEAGATHVKTGVEHGVNGVHESDLDGVGVFEDWDLEELVETEGVALLAGGGALALGGVMVEIAKALVAERGTSAGFSVDLDVLTKWYRGHDPSPYPLNLWNQRVRLEMRV